MALPNDSLFPQILPAQNNLMQKPSTLASATDMNDSIQTFLNFITGTTAIATIDPILTGVHMIMLIFTNANPGGVTTGGNIVAAVDPAQNAPILLVWNPVTAMWYAGKLAVG